MNYIISIFLKYLFSDIPLIITTLICMFFIIDVYLPKTNIKRRLITLLIIEGFEHIILPLLLIIILIFTDSWITAAFFHITLLSFLFVFLGFVVVKAKGRDWIRISAIAGFTYFFVFFYPFILIYIQIHSSIIGWWIMGGTIFAFFLFWLLFRKKVNYSPEPSVSAL